jgi:transcriptional pleiotropic regulator of transition state genes
MARVTMSVIRHSAGVRGRAASARAGGVVRRVDELGRIVIPVEIRRRFGIDVRDPLEISVRGETIVLSKPHDACVFCGRTGGLDEFHGRQVCSTCRVELSGDVVRAS